jgi:ubiquinone/menaquinone biosynthesis C-methylase UbiE
MRYTPKDLTLKKKFESVYARSQASVMLSIERSVCGCDYGGNSWTTQSEADDLATRLELRSGLRVLDLGAGAGWPALYFAEKYACDVVLGDFLEVGLRIAEERSVKDGLSQMVATVVADAADLPLSDNCFDAISHSDLLCCLERKRSVLDGCRRVIRPQGRMAFTVISITPGLSAEQHVRAIASGPQFVESDVDYLTLMAQTGWVITDHEDLTAAYADSCVRQIHADEAHEHELEALIGIDEFAARLAGWRENLVAIREGLFRREMFVVSPNPN